MPQPPKVASFQPGEKITATFETSEGTMVAELFADKCPMTVGNFVALATGEATWTDPEGNDSTAPFYDGTTFHRVIKDFMIQGGCPLGNGTGGPGYRFDDEFDSELKHDRPGVLSMANAGPGTNGSQFFITEKHTPWLDGKHTVFGRIVEGLDVMEKIAGCETGAMDRPRTAITIDKLTIQRG